MKSIIGALKLKVLTSVHKSIYKPGHYYSPIPSLKEVAERKDQIFDRNPTNLPGIDLNEEAQKSLMTRLKTYYQDFPFKASPSGLRYYYENTFFKYFDSFVLYALLREFKPRRLVEVGSGYSSAVILDTNDLFLEGSLKATFIEPYPDRLLSLLKENDKTKHKIIVKPVQEVEAAVFSQLGEGDILFIDSSHVAKVGSDVNHLLFHVLPTLNPGVLIHIHDIFYPFEYPEDWVMNGMFWNEAYMLRCFLIDNPRFEILQFNHYWNEHHSNWLASNMPLCNIPGGSIWLRKKG